MEKVLIAYYPTGETPKVVDKFESLFKEKKLVVERKAISLTPELTIKEQFKKEKKIQIDHPIKSVKDYDVIVIGTPIVSFSSVPAVNAFIRSLPKLNKKKIVLFATGIGLPGRAIKKMSSLLSMKGGIVIEGKVFSSIFEFDERKLKEVEEFFKKVNSKLFS